MNKTQESVTETNGNAEPANESAGASETALLLQISQLKKQLAAAQEDSKRLDWRTGTPDVAEGQREVFWCATRNRNGKVFYRHLVYVNKHVMPLSDSCYDVPEGAVPVGDDDEYEWTGWCQESCDHCETQWMFNAEVIAWMRLPKFDAARAKEGK